MIKNIIYVEDGSVDIDELEMSLNEETKIIVYRQGAAVPILVQPDKPIKTQSDENVKLVEKAKELQEGIRSYLRGARYDSTLYDLHVNIIDFLEGIKREFDPEYGQMKSE